MSSAIWARAAGVETAVFQRIKPMRQQHQPALVLDAGHHLSGGQPCGNLLVQKQANNFPLQGRDLFADDDSEREAWGKSAVSVAACTMSRSFNRPPHLVVVGNRLHLDLLLHAAAGGTARWASGSRQRLPCGSADQFAWGYAWPSGRLRQPDRFSAWGSTLMCIVAACGTSGTICAA
jgi:hypothetical protein